MKTILLSLLSILCLSISSSYAQQEDFTEEEFTKLLEEFTHQFKDVVGHFPSNFQNLKGDKVPESSNYTSLIQLNFSQDCYLNGRWLSDEFAFVGDFGEYESREDAANVYRNLIDLIGITEFDFSLVPKEINGENEDLYYWLVFDLNSDTYSNMVIKVRLISLPNFSFEEGAPDKTYSVVINIERV